MAKSKYLPIGYLLIISAIGLFNFRSREDNVYQRDNIEFKERPIFKFEEISHSAGITHKHELHSLIPSRRTFAGVLPVNASVAVGDVNNDGFMDLFFTNGKENKPNFLYLNDGTGKFFNATSEAGLGADLNADPTNMAAFLDIDNDGWTDLFLVKGGCHKLYKNNRGVFLDISAQTGIEKVCSHAAGVAVFDYDQDGFLDVYLYNNFRTSKNIFLSVLDLDMPRRKGPRHLVGWKNILLKNIDGLSFKDVTEKSGTGDHRFAWAAGISDINSNGYPDLFIANDFSINTVYLNSGDGSFENATIDRIGKQFYTGNMSVEFGDFDNDSLMDVFVSNVSGFNYFVGSMNFLYRQNKDRKYHNRSVELGVDRCGWAWGSKFFDVDLDGFLDLVVSNGFFAAGKKSFWYEWASYLSLPLFLFKTHSFFPKAQGSSIASNQRSCLFWQKNGSFYDVAAQVGLQQTAVGRGVAVIDLDNNGILDLAIANHNDLPQVYRTKLSENRDWIGFQLIGKTGSRQAYGAVIRLHTNLGVQTRELYPTNGFGSQSDPRLHFGIDKQNIKKIEIVWPGGKIQLLEKFKKNIYNQVMESA